MSDILKSVVIDPTTYFTKDEIADFRKFVAEYDHATVRLQTELERVNLEIAKLMGRA